MKVKITLVKMLIFTVEHQILRVWPTAGIFMMIKVISRSQSF